MAKPEKVSAVEEITEQFKTSTAAVVTEYRGLSVGSLTALRRALGEGATYSVAKNTLVKRAAAEAGARVSTICSSVRPPSRSSRASRWMPRRLSRPSRRTTRHSSSRRYMDGDVLSVDQVNKIADLESREVLLAKLAGAMKGNLAKAAGLFNAPASQVARLAAALQEKKAAEEAA